MPGTRKHAHSKTPAPCKGTGVQTTKIKEKSEFQQVRSPKMRSAAERKTVTIYFLH